MPNVLFSEYLISGYPPLVKWTVEDWVLLLMLGVWEIEVVFSEDDVEGQPLNEKPPEFPP